MASVIPVTEQQFRVRNPEYAAEVERVFDRAPFIRDLGVELLEFAPGSCETRLILKDKHLQQDGYVHAGVQATIADHTAGTAGATLLAAGQLILTAEFKINLLRAAKGDTLYCKARVIKPGGQLIVAESEVYCESDRGCELVSKATVTLAVVDKSRK